MQLSEQEKKLIELLKQRKSKQRGTYAVLIDHVGMLFRSGKAQHLIDTEGAEFFKKQFQLLLYRNKSKELAEFFNDVPPENIKELWVNVMSWLIGENGSPH